jgi:hypothetical protein
MADTVAVLDSRDRLRARRIERVIHTSISPQTWDLEPAGERDSETLTNLGLDRSDLTRRAERNTYDWLRAQFNYDVQAFNGFYDPRSQTHAAPQTVNLIAPFQLMAAFDRYQDGELLHLARQSADWLEREMVETHPMSVVLGGVRDNIKASQLWTKYTADYVVLNLGLWDRLQEEMYLDRAVQGSRFLLQAQNHGFSPKYNDWTEQWIERGWQSFGRVVCAMIALYEFTGDEVWLERAKKWGEYGLTLQAGNGCFYLINDTYYSSDLAADEIRGLIRLYLRCGDERYLSAAVRFADWHLTNQEESGAWCLSEDRWGVAVGAYVGPGDAPNIAVALLLMHRATRDVRYVAAAVRALRYSLTQQQLPDTAGAPYVEDPTTHWGFWSWDPPYDYTMSADQSTHHVRGYWFFLDYFLSLERETQEKILATYKDMSSTHA